MSVIQKKRVMLFNRTVDPLYPCATRTFIDGKFTYSSKRLSEDDFYGGGVLGFFSVITDSSPWPDSNQCGTERSGNDPEQGGGREALHCVFKLQWNPSGGARLLDHCVRALITLEEPVPRYHAGRGLVVLDTGWFCLRLNAWNRVKDLKITRQWGSAGLFVPRILFCCH